MSEHPEHESWPYEFVERSPSLPEYMMWPGGIFRATPVTDIAERARAHLASVKPQDASRGFTTDQERGDD